MPRCKPIAVGALAFLSLLLALPTAEAHAAVATPALPAITERFSPVLPCNPNTTIGQEGCAERRVLAGDKQLTSDAQLVFQRLDTDSARRDFAAAQRSWLAYRSADCKSQSDAYQGGSEQPVAYADCLAADDVSRRLALKAFYGVLTQGLGPKAPAFP
ncbi:MAG TPA: lysozyme inhibitor LprI family protein [Acidimicrobiales bacterium]|nr:lysozyme inhibitor LprI family protein [Acidimicrobiales bacterium]